MDDLPLTPLEEYFYHESCPAYPLQCELCLTCRGTLDREAFSTAVASVARRHPLLTASVQSRKSWRGEQQFWKFAVNPAVPVHWVDVAESASYPDLPARCDIHHQPGCVLRVWVKKSEFRCLLTTPHAVMDGKGMEQLVDDLFIHYALQMDSETTAVISDIDCSQSESRRKSEVSLWPNLRKLPLLLKGVGGILQFLQREPVRLSGKKHLVRDRSQGDQRTTLNVIFSQEKLQVYRKRGVVNLSLLEDFFQTILSWRQQRGIHNEDDWLRIAVPMDLRPLGPDRLSASNAVSLVFLDRNKSQIEPAGHLSRSLQKEMELIHRGHLKSIFIVSLNLSRIFIRNFRHRVLRTGCEATICVSNIGRFLRRTSLPRKNGKIEVGTFVIERVEFLSPIRPYLDVNIGVTEYAGELVLSVQYDPQALDVGDVEDLVVAFRQRIGSDETN